MRPRPVDAYMFHCFPRKVGSLVLIGILLAIAGCDPVRTVRQEVHVKVLDADGRPAANVKVNIRRHWKSIEPNGGANDYFESDDEYSSFEDITDESGKAVIEVIETAIDGTRGARPPSTRDIVTDNEYLFRLHSEPDITETLQVPMRAREVYRGEHFALEVTRIEQPEYIPTP